MTDNTELKRLAEALLASDDHADFPGWMAANDAFDNATGPAVVLALIAENEELGRYLCTCRDCGGEGALHTGDWHSYGHMEPPEPVMEKCGECDGTGLLGEVQDLYQVITERDQLCAEVAGLKTGYEAYERVNAELKAEVELLRSLLGQSALAATTLRTDAEAYANHSGFNRGFVDFIRSISGVEVGHGYGSSKYPQQADVVAALGQGDRP